MEQMVEALLFIQSANKEQASPVTSLSRLEQVSGNGHRCDHRLDARDQRLGFIFEPTRNRRDSRGVLENVPEERSGDTDGASETHVGPVKSCDEWYVGKSPDPGPYYSVGEPPVSVEHLRLEIALDSHRAREIGSEEPDQRQFCRPRRRDIFRHVAGVGEALEAARRVSEPFDTYTFELVSLRNSLGGRHYAPHFNPPDVLPPGEE
jgi:hypothetical protein